MKRLDRRVPLSILVLGLGACDAILGIPERTFGPRLECSNGACQCALGWGDCDGDDRNGCEVNLESDLDCGACGNRCANSTCVDGACACAQDYKDCDGAADNGCETDLRTELDCGDCNRHCDNGRCMAGACACLPGYADCDGSPDNGCEAPVKSDAVNCGACGHSCQGGQCDDGRCGPVVVVNASSVYQLVVDGDTLYYLSPEAIQKVPRAGGTPTKLCDSLDLFSVYPFRIWSGAAYWASDTVVRACPLDGSAPKVLGQVSKSGYVISDLVIGGGWLYWLEYTSLSSPVLVLRRTRADGTGMPSTALDFADYTFSPLFADDTGVYWVDSADTLMGLDHGLSGPKALSPAMPVSTRLLKKDGADFYLASQDGYYRWSLSGGAPAPLAPPSYYCGLDGCEALDQGDLYFLGNSSVRRAPLAGGEVTVVSPVTGGGAGAIAVDEAFVYFANYTSISRVEK